MTLANGLKTGAAAGTRVRPSLGLATLVLLASAGAAVADPQRAFHDDLERADVIRWERSDGWANNSAWGCGWRADHVRFEDGVMTLILDDTDASGRDFACGEYRTREHFGFGRYATSMKAARGEGVVTGFFIYTGPPFGDPWHDT